MKKKTKDTSLKEWFQKKAPQEARLNRMLVSSPQEIEPITRFIQPHNFRLYFDFSKKNFKPKKPPNHTLQKYKSMVHIFNPAYTYSSLNYGKEHMYKDFLFCTIRVKKNTVEVINHWHDKQWRRVSRNSINEINERIDEIVNDLKSRSLEALKGFIELHGGSSNFNVLKQRCEIGIHGDEYADKVPREYIIDDTYFKKVYSKKLEFKGVASIKNYISNRAIEQIAPDIAGSINALNHVFINKIIPVIEDFSENIKLHLSVMRGMQKATNKLNQRLSQQSIWRYIK